MVAGRAQRTMLAASLITLVLSCTVDLLLASVLLPLLDTHALSRYWWLLIGLPFLLALLHPRVVLPMLDRAFALMRREPLGQRIAVSTTARAAVWSGASS